MKLKSLILILGGLSVGTLLAFGLALTTVTSLAITSSTLDSTPIGGGTPSTGVFTTMTGTTINYSSAPTACSGVNNMAQGISNGTGNAVCVAGVHGGSNLSGCSTGSAAGSTCTVAVSLDVTMPDTNYKASCTQVNTAGFPFILGMSKSTTTVTVTIANGVSNEAVVSTVSEVDCTTFGS